MFKSMFGVSMDLHNFDSWRINNQLDFFVHYCLLSIRTKLYTIHIKFTVLWANEMSFKAWGGLISRDIIPHKGTRFYSPLRSHGQIRLSRFGFLTSTKLMANWFSCSCNRWKCFSTLFWVFFLHRFNAEVCMGAFGSRRTVARPRYQS